MFRGTERNGTVGARDSNTKMDLEGKHDFKRIDLAFFVVVTMIIWGSITQVVKVKQSRYIPRGFQEVKVPRFRDNGTGCW